MRTPQGDSRVLARAFATFTEAAAALQKSYSQLQGEVSKLRADLENANAELSRSLDENARARAFLAQVLDRLPCGVVVSGSDGLVRLSNPEARRLLEVESNPDLSFPLPEWLHLTPDACYIEHQHTFGTSPEKHTLAASVAPMNVAQGEAPEVIWILQDISDQRKFAAEREENRRARALAEIATVLAHEIRNPLASMELFSGLLGDATRLMPEAHEWVMHLQSGLRSLGATVNNVLQFHGKPPQDFQPVRIDRALQHTVQFLGPLAATQGLRIHLNNSAGAVTVGADSYRLQQVFLNIALNGFRAMASGGNLEVSLRWVAHSESRLVQIDFEDAGQGIQPEMLEKIFEPGVTTKKGSPGLGLSVCKRVVEQHGGTIEVRSRLGEGSTFTIYLLASEEVQ